MTDRAPVPYRFEPNATAAGLKQRYDGLEAGVETGDQVTVAGRLLLRRGQGKLVFGQLADTLEQIDFHGVLREAAELLKAEAEDPGASVAARRRAEEALVQLFVMTREHRGQAA